MRNSNPETPRVLELITDWAEDYARGFTAPEIATMYQVHPSTVYRRLKEAGARIRTKSQAKMQDQNPMWRGDEVKNSGLHSWVKSRLPKPEYCQECNIDKALDLANISNKYNALTYTRDLNNWKWICRKCHMLEDGRLERMYHGGAKALYESCILCQKEHLSSGLCGKHLYQFKTHGACYDY